MKLDYEPPSAACMTALKEPDPIIRTMLRPDPGKRYASVSDVYEAVAYIPRRPV